MSEFAANLVELLTLSERAQDGDELTAQEMARLEQLLLSDKSLCARYIEFTTIMGALDMMGARDRFGDGSTVAEVQDELFHDLLNQVNDEHTYQLVPVEDQVISLESELEAMACPIPQPQDEPELVFNLAGIRVWRGSTGAGIPLSRIGWIAGALAASVVGLVGWQYQDALFGQPAVATLATVHEAQLVDDDGLNVGQGAELTPGTYELREGFAEIVFDRGAVTVVEAPSRFTLIDDNAMALETGKTVTLVNDAADGFVVEAAGVSIMDLGTEFGVAIDQRGVVETMVFDGEVVLSELENGQAEQLRVTEGYSVSHELETGYTEIQPNYMGRSTYVRTMDDAQAWPTYSDSVRLMNSAPSVLADDAHRDAQVMLIPELKGVMLDQPVEAIIHSGVYHSFGTKQVVPIPAGTRVDSYLVRYHPDSETGGMVNGEISFPQPILGVVVKHRSIMDSNKTFGEQGVVYPNTTNSNAFGLEGQFSPNQTGDELHLLPDRHTLRFTLHTNNSQDTFRVFLASSPVSKAGD